MSERPEDGGADGAARPLALVADDQAECRGLLAEIVARNGFDVIEARSGAEAVDLALERRPEVILLDIVMPEMDGLEALARIRDEDHQVPVVIVSALDDPEHRERALQLGAVNFLRKPFEVKEISFVLEHIRLALEAEGDVRPVLDLVRERRTVIEMGAEPGRVAAVVEFFARELRGHYPRFELPLTKVRLALYEAIANAIEHGSLGIGGEAKSRALEQAGGLSQLVAQRRSEAPYRERKVHIEASYEARQVHWRVRDEGPGFPRAEREGAVRGAAPTALRGRGIHLLRHYMNAVEWNDAGNQVTLTLELQDRPRR